MKQTDWNKRKNRKWLIECTEEQLLQIANCVEDISRFISGQPQLMSCLTLFDNCNEIGEQMLREITPKLNPELQGASYGWSGGRCPNDYQRKEIATSYCTYKSIRKAISEEYDHNDVHCGEILTCEEGGAPMKVMPVIESGVKVSDYWTATDPDGKQRIYLSKPRRFKYSNGEGWMPYESGYSINSEVTEMVRDIFKLPKLTWEDEPFKFQVVMPKI